MTINFIKLYKTNFNDLLIMDSMDLFIVSFKIDTQKLLR